jgi:TonB family protein
LLLDRIAANPDDPTPYLDLAKIYVREQRFEDAAKLTEALTGMLRRAQTTRVPRVRESITVNASPVTTGTPLKTPPITPPAVAATGMIEPRKILHVMPVYPEGARAAGVQGIVVIEAVVDRDGNVTEPRVIQSVPLLDDAALAAVRQWKYRPTRVDGVAVPFSMTLTVAFGLK